MTKVKVFLWRGVLQDVIADTDDVEVEVVHADDHCEGLSDEAAADAYREQCLQGGFKEVVYEEGAYCDPEEDDDDDDDDDEEDFD
jgi:hypothetical protein